MSARYTEKEGWDAQSRAALSGHSHHVERHLRLADETTER